MPHVYRQGWEDAAQRIGREIHSLLSGIDGRIRALDHQAITSRQPMTTDQLKAAREAAELKSCPFCGSEAQIEPWHGGGPLKRMVSCANEACEVAPKATGPTPRKAIAAWNRRSLPEARTGEVERGRQRLGSWTLASIRERVALNDHISASLDEAINAACDLAAIALSVPVGGRERALEDVAAERRRHVQVEGWTPEHDDEHAEGEMANAAACYVLSSTGHTRDGGNYIKSIWPWDWKWWKPKDRRRDLVRAGALILAEIERLDRATCRAGEQHDTKCSRQAVPALDHRHQFR